MWKRLKAMPRFVKIILGCFLAFSYTERCSNHHLRRRGSMASNKAEEAVRQQTRMTRTASFWLTSKHSGRSCCPRSRSA